MRDTTMEANAKTNMAQYYLYHSESPASRWAIAVEQPTQETFNVSVLYREPDWDVFGTIRYWVFEDRVDAEARYLELQKLFRELAEDATIKAIVRQLPEEERHWGEEA
jgi:hypothetical protein